MHRIDTYTALRVQSEERIGVLRRKRTVLLLFRVAAATLFLCGGYLYWVGSAGEALGCILTSLIGFAVTALVDQRLTTRIEIERNLIGCCDEEYGYLSGTKSAPGGSGEQYADPHHPYACDLDLFGEGSLFQTIDRSVTPAGRDRLAHHILYPSYSTEEILQRQTSIEELGTDPQWLLRFRAIGRTHPVTAGDQAFIEAWQKEPLFFRQPIVEKGLWVAAIVSIAAWMGALLAGISYYIPLALFLLYLGIVGVYLKGINRIYSQFGGFLASVGNYVFLVETLKMKNWKSPALRLLRETLLDESQSSLRAFAQLRKLQSRFDQRNNILVALLLNGLFLQELRNVVALDTWRKNWGSSLGKWMSAVSELETHLSLALFRYNHPAFHFPQPTSEVWIEATAMGHPLCWRSAVCNDFRIVSGHQFTIITGANMAGKSTFLRAIGTNLVLAEIGAPVFCRQMRFMPMPLYTSMRTTDNLLHGTSYFQAELLRLKELVKRAEEVPALFVILDEMLKGTNSRDKLHGSIRFLLRLLRLPVSGIVATHDLELGSLSERSPSHFENRCFEIRYDDCGVHYDYKLSSGISQNMNATYLLEEMGLILPEENKKKNPYSLSDNDESC